jgi:hypothetical protein
VVREVRIENGKLFYEKRWFRRGQTVHVEAGLEKTRFKKKPLQWVFGFFFIYLP